MTRIRDAIADDIEMLVEMGRQFCSESPYDESRYDADVMRDFLLNALEHKDFCVYVADRDGEIEGAACMFMTRVYFTADLLYGTEMFWYVRPEQRGQRVGPRLHQAMEDWARESGCELAVMGAFAQRAPRGYEPLERTFYRRIQEW